MDKPREKSQYRFSIDDIKAFRIDLDMPLLMCWRFKSQVINQLCRKTINYIFIFSDNYKSRTLHKSPSQSDELPQSKSEEKPAEEVWV